MENGGASVTFQAYESTERSAHRNYDFDYETLREPDARNHVRSEEEAAEIAGRFPEIPTAVTGRLSFFLAFLAAALPSTFSLRSQMRGRHFGRPASGQAAINFSGTLRSFASRRDSTERTTSIGIVSRSSSSSSFLFFLFPPPIVGGRRR